jgi:activator of HSP90 ATPase
MPVPVTSFKQQVTFNASPEEMYEQIMDAKKHAKFTGDKVSMSRKVGGEFSLLGGTAYGKNIELIPGKKIVQTWRMRQDNWPEDVMSEITFDFQPAGKNKTKLVFTQRNIPTNVADEFKQGWKDYYWEPMKAVLNK